MIDDVFQPGFPYPDGYDKTIQQQIESRGYAFEEHKAVTEDGYILTLFRVPRKQGSGNGQVKLPIFMQHGLIDDGGTWFFNNQTLDLSLQLVDLGYDVWVTNNRGTVYSNEHTTLTVDDQAYWNFTYNEMGKYDVPANLHYILFQTGAKQVIYFGHSQGTTQWFIANALNQSLSQYFKAFVGLAPVAHVTRHTSVLVKTLDLLEIPDLLHEYVWEFLYVPAISTYAAPFLHFFPRTVWTFLETMVGFDKMTHIYLGSLPMMGRNDVGGTSTKNLMHWMQNIRSGNFAQFDYGAQGNMQMYGKTTPPDYELRSFKTNLANVNMLLFTGSNDALVAPSDLAQLRAYLPVNAKVVTIADYNHLDYMWAADVNEKVNNQVLEFIKGLN